MEGKPNLQLILDFAQAAFSVLNDIDHLLCLSIQLYGAAEKPGEWIHTVLVYDRMMDRVDLLLAKICILKDQLDAIRPYVKGDSFSESFNRIGKFAGELSLSIKNLPVDDKKLEHDQTIMKNLIDQILLYQLSIHIFSISFFYFCGARSSENKWG